MTQLLKPLVSMFWNHFYRQLMSVSLCLLPLFAIALPATQTVLPNTYYFEWSANCREAYRAIMSLQLDKGKRLLQTETKQAPNNLMPTLLEDYIDLFTIFITEDAALFQQLEPNKAKRLARLGQASDSSPYRRYAQAEINLHWAVARLKFEQYFVAFRETYKAYQLLEENKRYYPNFYPNLKTIGLIHALIGTIPSKYKWGVNLLGLSGDIKGGMAELDNFVQQSQGDKDRLFYEEGALLHLFLVAYLQNKPQQAWQTAAQLPTDNNLLYTFVAADMALRAGNNDHAIAILSQRPTVANGFYDFPYLDFLMGACKLNRADVDANVYLQRFLNRFRGKNYIKDAFQRLAWYSLLNQEPEGYELYMSLCRTQGASFIDADKQALQNAQLGKTPHADLLKARLLFDGGYCTKAAVVMDAIATTSLKTTAYQLEYQYRYGRIYECKNNIEQAISRYKKVVELDTNSNTMNYFAPKACLQLGNIYEQQGYQSTARDYYQKSLRYKNHDYKNSFEQQAKAGLGRLAD